MPTSCAIDLRRKLLLCFLKIDETAMDEMNIGSEVLFLFDVDALYNIWVVNGIEGAGVSCLDVPLNLGDSSIPIHSSLVLVPARCTSSSVFLSSCCAQEECTLFAV